MPPKIRALVFDLDGTLLDTAPDFVVVLNRLRAERDLPPLASEQIRRSVSNGARGLIQLGFDVQPGDPDYEPLRQRLLEIYAGHLAVHTRLFPGIEPLLKALGERQVPWGIATNKPAAYALPLMEAMSLQPEPGCLICPDHVDERKPHPESLLLAAKHLGCRPHELVYIGDHRRDIDCGRRAGAVTIAASYGYIEEDDPVAEWQADYQVTRADQLLPLIKPWLI